MPQPAPSTPVVAAVAVAPPIPGEPLGANGVRDRQSAATPENAAGLGVAIHIDFLRGLQ